MVCRRPRTGWVYLNTTDYKIVIHPQPMTAAGNGEILLGTISGKDFYTDSSFDNKESAMALVQIHGENDDIITEEDFDNLITGWVDTH